MDGEYFFLLLYSMYTVYRVQLALGRIMVGYNKNQCWEFGSGSVGFIVFKPPGSSSIISCTDPDPDPSVIKQKEVKKH
jgi:hypothetical protein